MYKKILITGKNSYIGNELESYLNRFGAENLPGTPVNGEKALTSEPGTPGNGEKALTSEPGTPGNGEKTLTSEPGTPVNGQKALAPAYSVDKISLREPAWEQAGFGGYDAVFHVAGLAHADIGHVSEETGKKYYEVNCDLAVKAAEKARREGVRQFIYMSSVIVYGDSAPVGQCKHITADTVPAPANFYGDSKYQAEIRLRKLETEDFHVAVVRAPMVYGRGSRGNFPLLAKLAQKAPVFPSIENSRSMIYIENLTEFLRLLLESGGGGIYYPQNEEYISTVRMVRAIAAANAAANAEKIKFWRILNPFVRLAARVPGRIGGMANKAFGSLTIDQELSRQGIDGYQKYSLEESIKRIYEG